MTHRTRRATLVAAAAGLSLAALLPAVPAVGATTAAAATSTAPGGLKVVRTGADLTDLSVTWRPVAGVDHYTVSVFDGTRDRAVVVPAGTTSFSHDGSGVCTRYRVRVSAVGTDGSVATTNDYLVGSLAPGGSGRITATRTESGAAGTITWQGATWVGSAPLDGYDVRVTRMSDGVVIHDARTAGTTLDLQQLDPRRQYSVKVTPTSAMGSCATGTTVLYGAQPSQPAAFTAVRDPATPARVVLTWQPPAWSGYGPVTEYEVGYGRLKITDWVRVTGASRVFTLDPDVSHVFAVRAVSSDDKGNLSRVVKLNRFTETGTPVVDPKVTIVEKDGTVSVDVAGPVGSNATYPKMAVRVQPTLANAGAFRDEHVVANGAASVEFTQIPCGVYTVSVTGFGSGPQREFARQIVNRCDTGLLDKGKWKLVFGRATINGNSVDMTTGTENRVMSTTARTSPDMVFTTTAHLTSGWGYGIWARANLENGGSVSGYSFQYDPGYANVNPGFGKALLLRLWSQGKECGTPLAKVPFPAGIDVYSPHRVVVAVKGDTLYATIDNMLVFNVESLTEARAKSGCAMPLPTGTDVGFRTWNSTTAKFTGTTLS